MEFHKKNLYNHNLDTKLDFGEFKGKTVQQVIDTKPTYIKWCIKNVDHFYISTEALQEIKKYTENFSISEQEEQKLADKYDKFVSEIGGTTNFQEFFEEIKEHFKYNDAELEFEEIYSLYECVRTTTKSDDGFFSCQQDSQNNFFIVKCEYNDEEMDLFLVLDSKTECKDFLNFLDREEGGDYRSVMHRYDFNRTMGKND